MKNVLQPASKSVLVAIGLAVGASATDVAIKTWVRYENSNNQKRRSF